MRHNPQQSDNNIIGVGWDCEQSLFLRLPLFSTGNIYFYSIFVYLFQSRRREARGGTAMYGLYRYVQEPFGMCRSKGYGFIPGEKYEQQFQKLMYGFQAVYSEIGYINQRVQVQNGVSFSRKLINWLKILVQTREAVPGIASQKYENIKSDLALISNVFFSRDSWGRRNTKIVAIDAHVFRCYTDQLEAGLLKRELNKVKCKLFNLSLPLHLQLTWGLAGRAMISIKKERRKLLYSLSEPSGSLKWEGGCHLKKQRNIVRAPVEVKSNTKYSRLFLFFQAFSGFHSCLDQKYLPAIATGQISFYVSYFIFIYLLSKQVQTRRDLCGSAIFFRFSRGGLFFGIGSVEFLTGN